MKKKLFILGAAVLLAGQVWADLPAGYQMQSDSLSVVVAAPPALVYMTDGQGRKTGADPSKALNPDGSQAASGLSEIPLSQVVQTPLSAPDSSTPTPAASLSPVPASPMTQTPVAESVSATPAPAGTGWTFKILDGGTQTYTVYLKGVTFGVANVTLSGSFKNLTDQPSKTFSLLMAPGVTRRFDVMFDTDQKSIDIHLAATARDLSNDVQLAAKLNLVTSSHTVAYLSSKANAAQGGNRTQQGDVRNDLELFLHGIGESRPRGCVDEDDSADVKDSAREIFKEEVQVLLDKLPPTINVKL